MNQKIANKANNSRKTVKKTTAKRNQDPAVTRRTVKKGSGGGSTRVEVPSISTPSPQGVTSLGPLNVPFFTANPDFTGDIDGFASLTLYSNGLFHFTGHFHYSGTYGYDVGLAIVIVDELTNTISHYFYQRGHVAGTLQSGSRDFDWDYFRTNPSIQNNFNKWSQGYLYAWEYAYSTDSVDVVDLVNNAAARLGLPPQI